MLFEAGVLSRPLHFSLYMAQSEPCKIDIEPQDAAEYRTWAAVKINLTVISQYAGWNHGKGYLADGRLAHCVFHAVV